MAASRTPDVGSALSRRDEDDDDWGESYARELVNRSPYGATVVRVEELPEDRGERLQAIEAGLFASTQARDTSVAWSQIRWTVETGALLRVLVEEDLYLEAGYSSLDAYATERLHRSRGYLYELINTSAALLTVAPLSEISDRPFNAAQARLLAPLMVPSDPADPESPTRAAVVVEDITKAGQKRTVVALKRAAKKLGFLDAPAVPGARETTEDNQGDIVDEAGAKAVSAVRDLLLKQQAVYDGLGGGVLPAALEADPQAVAPVLEEFIRHAERTVRRLKNARPAKG